MMKNHTELMLRAQAWLLNRITGKGVRYATEVRIGDGYVADVVALCSFQWRLARVYGCVTGEQTCRNYRQHVLHSYACVFECKASRSDFLATFGSGDRHKDRSIPVGHLHWVVANKDVVSPNELPSSWGLLQVSSSGLKEVVLPTCIQYEDNLARLDRIAYKLLWAQGNHRSRESEVNAKLQEKLSRIIRHGGEE